MNNVTVTFPTPPKYYNAWEIFIEPGIYVPFESSPQERILVYPSVNSTSNQAIIISKDGTVFEFVSINPNNSNRLYTKTSERINITFTH